MASRGLCQLPWLLGHLFSLLGSRKMLQGNCCLQLMSSACPYSTGLDGRSWLCRQQGRQTWKSSCRRREKVHHLRRSNGKGPLDVVLDWRSRDLGFYQPGLQLLQWSTHTMHWPSFLGSTTRITCMNILVFLCIQIFSLPHLCPGEVQRKPRLVPQHVFHSYILARLSFLLLSLKHFWKGSTEAMRGVNKVWRMGMSRTRRIKTFNHVLGTLDRMSTSLRGWNQLQVPTPRQISTALRASALFCHVWEWAATGWLHLGSASCPPQKSLLGPSSTHPARGLPLGSAPGWLSEHPCAAFWPQLLYHICTDRAHHCLICIFVMPVLLIIGLWPSANRLHLWDSLLDFGCQAEFFLTVHNNSNSLTSTMRQLTFLKFSASGCTSERFSLQSRQLPLLNNLSLSNLILVPK